MIMKRFNREWTKPATRQGSITMCLFLSPLISRILLLSWYLNRRRPNWPNSIFLAYHHLSPSLPLYYSPSAQRIIIFSAQRLLFHISRLTAGLIKPTKYFNIRVCARVYIQCMWRNNFISSTVCTYCAKPGFYKHVFSVRSSRRWNWH